MIAPSSVRRGSCPLGLKLVPVLAQVIASRNEFKVGKPVVQLVPTDVMQDHTGGHRTVCLLPDDPRPQLPHVGLCRLHEGSRLTRTIAPGANPHGADRQHVPGSLPRSEGAWLVVRTLPKCGIATLHRTVPSNAASGLKANSTLGAGMVHHLVILMARAGTCTSTNDLFGGAA